MMVTIDSDSKYYYHRDRDYHHDSSQFKSNFEQGWQGPPGSILTDRCACVSVYLETLRRLKKEEKKTSMRLSSLVEKTYITVHYQKSCTCNKNNALCVCNKKKNSLLVYYKLNI
jgi:hypothetical protein